MRKALYAAFLLATTALYPSEAKAMPPVLGFVGGLITALGAPAFGGAIVGLGGAGALGGFAAGWGFASSFIGGALIQGALSLGVTYLTSLLRPKPQQPQPAQRFVNMRQPISFMEFVYGFVRKGGPVNFWQALNDRRYYQVILAAHEIDGIEAHYCDEVEVVVDVDGFVVAEDDGPYRSEHVRMFDYLGAPGQVSPPLLKDNFAEWTEAHDMAGLAHTVAYAENASAENFSEIFPGGREPVINKLVRGRKVYDPRTDTTGFSVNAALIIAHWITSPDGLNRQVDWDKVAIEADESDIIVTDRTGNPSPKWELSGAYSGADDRETVRAQMGVACDCFFYEDENGIVGFNVGRYIAPTVTISDQDIIRIQYSEGQSGTDIANAMSVQYTEPEQGWREAASATYEVTAEGEAYSEDSLQVYWLKRHNQAVRVSKRLLKAARAEYRASMSLKYHGARLIGQRFFRLAHSEFGIDKTFEVDRFSRGEDGLTWSVEAHSVEPEDFDFDAVTEEPEKPRRSTIETDDTIPPPENVTAALEPFAGSISIRVEWDPMTRRSLLNQVRYRENPAGEWFELSVPPQQYYQRIVGLSDGKAYDVQVRSITSTGRGSDWVPNDGDEANPTLTVGVITDSVPPQDLASFAVAGGLGHASISISTAAGDTHLHRVSIYRVPTGVPLDRNVHTRTDIAAAPGTSFIYPDGDATRTELIVNGNFATDTVWTKGVGWTISGGQAVAAAGSASSIFQTVAGLVSGDVIRIGLDISGMTAGALTARLIGGTAQVVSDNMATNGTHFAALTVASPTPNTSIGATKSSSFDGDIDNFKAYVETTACLPSGVWDYYVEPLNVSGIAGGLEGPITVTVV